MRMTREFFIPAGGAEETFTDVNAVVYRLTSRKGTPAAVGFSGRRAKPDFNYSFHTEERREQYIQEWLDGLRQTKQYKDDRKAERKAFQHDFKVGDILYSSWGYDQTNIDFYQVIEVPTQKTIVIREIAGTLAERDGYHMSGYKTALADRFLNGAESMRKIVQPSNSVRLTSFSSAWKWDGQPKYCSWYA